MKKVAIAGVALWGIISSAAAMSLDELLAKDIQCDKPFDMMTPHGKAVAETCIKAIATGMDPAMLVKLELATFKLGYGHLGANSQWLVDHQPGLQEYLGSRK